MMLGQRVFCYRAIAADPLQPEVGLVVSDLGGNTFNVVGWTEHGASFLMEAAPCQTNYQSNLDNNFVTESAVRTLAKIAADDAAKAAADLAAAQAAADKAAADAAAKAAADAAEAAKAVTQPAAPVPGTPAPVALTPASAGAAT